MIDFFIKHVLNTPGLFSKYKTKDIYPVVLGGIDVLRCTKQGSTVDIDIKFVIIPQVQGADDPVFKLAVQLRNAFLKEILAIAKKQQQQQQQQQQQSLVDFSLGEVDTTFKTQRLCIYQDDHSQKSVLIDTGIFSNYSVDKFDQFRNFFQDRVPIPIKIIDHIPYATCSWTLVDTVRMLVNCREQATNEYWRKKYVKYQAKFALMYNAYNHTERATKAYQYATEYLATSGDTATVKLIDDLLLNLTNEHEIETKFLDLNIDHVYQSILNFFMMRVLGKYMMKPNNSFYPLVIGGVDVNRCISPAFKLAIKDVDIQYIVKNDKFIDAAKINKYHLVESILNDEDMAQFLKEQGYKITLSAFSDWDPATNQKQIDLDLTIIMVNFIDDQGTIVKTKNMVDLIILTRPFWTTKGSAVPWYTDKVTNVTFATCEYTYHDTIYMIKWYEDHGITSKKGMAKYLRYILKFLGLYMVRNKSRNVFKSLRPLYKQVLHTVKGLGLHDGVPDIYTLVDRVKQATFWT